MAARIRWLKTALKNFAEEISYIASDDPAAASLVARRIADTVALLATQPAIGRPGRIPGTRELLVPKTRYLVPYRVRRGVVEILRVFHTSRRPPKRW
ncbi:MAG: type II toxin-antitoxin system RelE/ParE family toxin [Candidatus Sulfotelmatobacter sp.]|jgi:plasmid stabilization system protein ParE